MQLRTTGAEDGALDVPLVVVAVAQDGGEDAGGDASSGVSVAPGRSGEAATALAALVRAMGGALQARLPENALGESARPAQGHDAVGEAQRSLRAEDAVGGALRSPQEDAAGGASRSAEGVLRAALETGDFSASEEESVLVYADGAGGPRRILFCGVGPRAELSAERMREFGGRAARAAEMRRLRSLAVVADHVAGDGAGGDAALWQGLAEGLVLGSWRFGELATASGSGDAWPGVEEAALAGAGRTPAWREAVRAGREFAEGENLARALQARPGNLLTPTALADAAVRVADYAGLACRVLGPREMEAERMGALLSVARGSNEEPRLIVLRHTGGPADDPPLVLVGKGLTFDAGGISIKPAKGMEDMKYDMSGGAAVLGAMQAVGRLGLPVNVVGVVPSSENLLGGSATKPGDVVTTRAGKTVEVINTDAEGRLVLADALDYARQWRPAAVVDCATLTGACVVALGSHRSGLLGNDGELLRELVRAGDAAGQRAWRLPLDQPYRKQLDSQVADLKNVGGREAGTITAACFLAEFAGDAPWAHLDVAGTAYGKTDRPYLRDGPAGTPCRLLLEWVRMRAARADDQRRRAAPSSAPRADADAASAGPSPAAESGAAEAVDVVPGRRAQRALPAPPGGSVEACADAPPDAAAAGRPGA